MKNYRGMDVGSELLKVAESEMRNRNGDAAEVMGMDDRKLKSSMTLFDAATESSDVFQRVLDKYYDGKKDYRTLRMLGIK